MKSLILRIIAALTAVAGLIWFCIPIHWNVLNIGNIAGIAVCAFVLLVCLFYPVMKRKRAASKGWKILCRTVGALFFIGLVWAAFLTVLMFSGANHVPPENATVVVLGSKVSGHFPSADLRIRIEASKDYLTAHPNAKCIVSGGQGAGELETEAAVMKKNLVQMGIDSSRVILEDRSTTTQENLEYSLQIINQKGMSRDVAIVTDEYHQYRAGQIAKNLGIKSYSVNAHTPWYIFSACYARELLALTKFLILP